MTNILDSKRFKNKRRGRFLSKLPFPHSFCQLVNVVALVVMVVVAVDLVVGAIVVAVALVVVAVADNVLVLGQLLSLLLLM